VGKFVVKTVKLRFQKKVKTAETLLFQRFSMARWKGLDGLCPSFATRIPIVFAFGESGGFESL
jgi:hypothetical protein